MKECLNCSCYEPDYESCTMPDHDKWFACKAYDNSKELAEILYNICSDMDYQDYTETQEEDIRNLANDIRIAREMNLDTLVNALQCICICEAFIKKGGE